MNRNVVLCLVRPHAAASFRELPVDFHADFAGHCGAVGARELNMERDGVCWILVCVDEFIQHECG